MRALVGGLVHESSTFATALTGPTTLADFAVHAGADLVDEFTGTNTCVGGFLAGCAAAGVTVVPTRHARAEPGATVEETAYRHLADALLASLRTDCELVLLDLHGAGVVGATASLEADLLRSVRAVVGPGPVVAVVLDLHGNLPPEVGELADVVVGFQEYPHTDMAERARRATAVAVATARGRVRPQTRQLRLPMVLPPSPTDEGPARELRELARAAEREPGVLACTVFHGFPYADTPQAGTSLVTVVDGDPDRADRVNERLAGWLWRHREAFRPDQLLPADAVARASTDTPVVLGDAADNPGGGATGDGTDLLRAILDAGVRACFATLHDPEAVNAAVAAGTGATVRLRLGGRHGTVSGPPLPVTARVDAVSDGRVVQRSVRQGKTVEFGRCVRLAVGAVDLVVASNRVQVFDPEILLLHDIDPANYPLVAVKSAYHFRSGFRYLGRPTSAVDGPGLTGRRIERLTPRTTSARLWPMDPYATWPAAVGEPTGRVPHGLTHRRKPPTHQIGGGL